MAWSDWGSGDKLALRFLHVGSLWAGPASPTPQPRVESILYLHQTFQQAVDSVGPWGQPRKNSPSPPPSKNTGPFRGYKFMAEAEGQRLLQAAFESQPHTQRPLGSFPPASGSRLLAGKMKGICEEAGAFVTPLTPGSPFQGPRGRPRWLSCGKADLREAWGQLRPCAGTASSSHFSGQDCLLWASVSFSVTIGG